MRLFIFFSLICTLHSCGSKSQECDFEYIYNFNIDSISSNPHWVFCSGSIYAYILGEPGVVTTDAPIPYLLLYNKVNKQSIVFRRLGNFEIVDEKIFLLSKNMTMQNSIYGWFKKNEEGAFVDVVTGENLIYENNLIYKKKGKRYFVHNCVPEIDNCTPDGELSNKNLYKLDASNNKLELFSSKSRDIIDVKNGIYYVPFPGIYVDKLIYLNELANRLYHEQNISCGE